MSDDGEITFDFKTVPTIRFANGAALELAEQLIALKVKKPLIVSDAGIIKSGVLAPALEALTIASFSAKIYSDVVADPPESNVLNALEYALSMGCDGVIGFGGGSSMDVAKLVAVLMSQEQSLQEIYGVDQVHSSRVPFRVPLIQIPTTAGTGSEATGVAIVTTGESSKAGVVSDRLLADVIILDPQLTLGLPAHITAATGIDAMVHAVEAFTSKRLKNPISDMLALKALALMSGSIQTAVKEGSNSEARSNMLLGAMLAGQAFANAPVGAVHALAYPLGGTFHIPHGLSNSLVLPHVLRFNGVGNAMVKNSSINDLYTQVLVAIGFSERSLTLSAGDTETFNPNASETLADYFLNLATDLGLPSRLQELKITMSDLPKLAQEAILQQRLLINNPREVSYDDALQIYQNAF